MQTKKIIQYSNNLNRNFHFDRFYTDENPLFQVLFFGGSGMSEKEYLKRSNTIATIFIPYLKKLVSELKSTPFDFTFITAPFDLNIRQLSENEELQNTWRAHITTDILSHLANAPIYWIGYSGGFILGWYGLVDVQECFGAGALGGDQLSNDIYWPAWWPEELRLYYNIQDSVFTHNSESIQYLTSNEEAKFYRALQGTHALNDYLKNESFGGLIRRAAFIFQAKTVT